MKFETVIKTKVVLDSELYDLEEYNAFINIMTTYVLGFEITERVFANPKVKSLLQSEETFDLVIVEQFLNEAHMIFGHHFKAPVVLFSSLGASEWTNHLVGNPAPYSYIPLMYSGYTTHMNFWQRLRNTVLSIFDTFYKELIVFPTQRKILTRYFPDAPDLSSLMYNASIVLLNSDISINEPVPHVPSMIDVGGFHVQPHGKLPSDLKKVLDGAENGVVVFSMGSNLRSADLSESQMKDILEVFGKLKQLVVWKWENDVLPGKPSNVMTMKWLPQQEVLGMY